MALSSVNPVRIDTPGNQALRTFLQAQQGSDFLQALNASQQRPASSLFDVQDIVQLSPEALNILASPVTPQTDEEDTLAIPSPFAEQDDAAQDHPLPLPAETTGARNAIDQLISRLNAHIEALNFSRTAFAVSVVQTPYAYDRIPDAGRLGQARKVEPV